MAEGRRVFTDAIYSRPSGCKNSIARLLQKDVRRARYLDAKTSRWLTTDPALGEYLDQSSKGEGGAFNVLNLNLYHYGNNNPVKYTDPDGESVFGAAIIGGLISAGIDYAFQVGGNYLQGERGAELLTDVNAGEIVGAFVSGALTTVGLGAVTKVVGIAESTIARKGIQIAGSAAVSAAASVPGTIAENFVNNKINPDNKVALAKNIKDNAIKSGIAGGLVSVGAKTPPKNVKTPSWYEPNNIPYKQVGPNKYVRKGLMPGTKQAGVIQFTKDVMNEVYGQGVSKGVSAGYDKFTTHKKEHSIEN